MIEIKRQYTDNPFMDILLYSVKFLACNAVIKDESQALLHETEESLKRADILIYSMNKTGTFEMYNYTDAMLAKVGVPKVLRARFIRNKNDIPEHYREALVEVARKDAIDNYIEKNEYYRTIMGLPPYGDDGIPVQHYTYLLPANEQVTASYAHEMGTSGAQLLERYGIIDAMKRDYPKAKYLDYMSAGISAYKARTAIDKRILHLYSCGDKNIDDIFEEKYELARVFTSKCVQTSAMEYNSEHYNAFLTIYILFLAIIDTVSELQTHIIKKDILDRRCIEYIFKIYGVPFYKNIPLKYQIILCKNLNSLLQYKSSPQEMLNLIMFFRLNSVKLNKEYLIRDRKTDVWGNYEYNYKEYKTSKFNTDVKHQTEVKEEDTSTELTVPFPFEFYLNKGNKMWIFIDDMKLKESDYEIYNGDKIKFKKYNNGTHKIRYEFYYDIGSTDGGGKIEGNVVFMKFQHIDSDTDEKTFNLELPYSSYLKDGNNIIISIASLILNTTAYNINITNRTVTIDRGIDTLNKHITIIYPYSNESIMKYETKAIQTSNRKSINIPELFPQYYANGNSFFITKGAMFISDERYTFDIFTGTLEFVDDEDTLKNTILNIHYIYSSDSIYKSIMFENASETIVATEKYQTVFTINPPITDYYDKGWMIYIETLDWFIDDTYFDYFQNTIQFKDTSMALDIGDTLTVHYIWSDTTPNTRINRISSSVTKRFQDKFKFTFPIDNFFAKNNKVIISIAGIPLKENIDYVISGDEFTIINVNYRPYVGQKYDVLYVYNVETENAIKMKQDHIVALTDNQKKFYTDFPFYPYIETGHRFMVYHNSTYIDRDLITFGSNYIELDLDDVTIGDKVTVLYVFNNKFVSSVSNRLKVSIVTLDKDNVNEDFLLKIPTPFEDYIDHDWHWFVDSKDKWIWEKDFNVINSSLAFVKADQIKNYDSFTFTFIYKDAYPWVRTERSEDFDKDMELKFLTLPLDSFMDSSVHLKQKEKIKSYDSVTMSDRFWDGPEGRKLNFNSLHEKVKRDIIRQKFNYIRTKYMGVEYLVDISEMAFRIPYFYNILWDNVYKEELLTVEIPSILPYHKFKLGHIFCYMTALMYIFKDIKDTIMDTPTKILYVKGFNFKADLKKLQDWIINSRVDEEKFKDAFKFIIPSTQITNIDEFVNMYKTNKDVWGIVTKGMATADTYDIYKIWKKLYDSLMTYEFNLKYFQLNDGTQAPTFTDFLKEKDNTLYLSIMDIKNIGDKESKEASIIDALQNIVYILEQWIDSSEFHYIYTQLPGVAQEYMMEYLFTIINFFKSYKVIMNQMTISFNIGQNKNDPDSYIRPNDLTFMNVYTKKIDYMDTMREAPHMDIKLIKDERIKLKENLMFDYTYD